MELIADRHVALAALQERIHRLEELGFPRSGSSTVRQYFQDLAADDIVPVETAAAIASLYDQCRFNRTYLAQEQDFKEIAALDTAIARVDDAGEEQRRAVVERFHRRREPASRMPPRGAPPPRTGRNATPARLPREPNRSERRRNAEVRKRLAERGPSRLWTFIACGLVIWTMIVMAGSLWQRERILSLLIATNWGKAFAMRLENAGHAQDELRRLYAPGQLRHDPAVLVNLGDQFSERGDYAEAISLYHRALARAEGNIRQEARACNNLAWLLLTAKDRWYHDQRQARLFAGRAVSLAPRQPAYLDTLAEAYFQTGELTLAMETERQALAEASPTSVAFQHYHKQLARFERALAAPGIAQGTAGR